MSVLFQALERAALDGRLQQQPSLVPYLSSDGGRKDPRGIPFAMALILAACLGAGAATATYGFSHIMVLRQAREGVRPLEQPNATMLSASAIAPQANPPKPDVKNYLGAEEIPPDLAQGITLSSPVPAVAIPDRDTKAVMQKLQDAPAFADAPKKTKPMQLEVRDAVSPELLKKAHDALVAQDYKGALALYNQALSQAPDHETVLAGKAYALQQMGHYPEALAIEQTLFEKNPNDFAVKANLVDTLAAIGSADAMQKLQKIIEKQSSFGPAYAALGKIEMAQGKKDDAASHFKRAIELEPKNASYKMNLAVLSDRMGQSDEALALYKQVLEMKDATHDVLPLSWDAIEQRIAYLSGK